MKVVLKKDQSKIMNTEQQFENKALLKSSFWHFLTEVWQLWQDL